MKRQITGDVAKGERWHQGHCYCILWERSPETLQEQGVPKGYCGFCDVCGKAGHTMHFPGPVPRTGTWCKFHYYRTMILHPSGYIGAPIWKAIVLGVIVTLIIN